MNTESSYFEIINDCKEIIASIKSCKINFLAIDFDLTMVGIHTGGRVGLIIIFFRRIYKFYFILFDMRSFQETLMNW